MTGFEMFRVLWRGSMAGLAMSCAAVLSVAAQEAGAPAFWQNTCAGEGDQKVCLTSQGIFREGGVLLFGVEFRVQATNPGPLLRVISPLGLLLPKGLLLKVDGSDLVTLTFERCAERGCESFAAVTPEMIDKLNAGKELQIAFWPNADASQQIVVPLTDFAPNFAQIATP